jgi:hypothetical protein
MAISPVPLMLLKGSVVRVVRKEVEILEREGARVSLGFDELARLSFSSRCDCSFASRIDQP